MTKLVIERKSQKVGTAVELETGKMAVTFEDGTGKEVTASTFKRNFKVTGEVQEEEQMDLQINIGGQTIIPDEVVEEKVEAPTEPVLAVEVPVEIKVMDYVQFAKDADFDFENNVGIVVDVVGKMATVMAVENNVALETGFKVDQLVVVERQVAEDTFTKIEAVLEKHDTDDTDGEADTDGTNTPEPTNEPVAAEKPANKAERTWTPQTGYVAPEYTDKQVEEGAAWCESGIIDTVANNKANGQEIVMIAREIGDFKSKGQIYPKYFDTFAFYGFTLKVTYIHIWGSTKVELFDEDGVQLYKSPTGALKPLFDFLMFNGQEQKEAKIAIREGRNNWVQE